MSESSVELWNTTCGKFPKAEIVYFCQVVVIIGVVVACIVNLSIGTNEKDSLWSSLLSASVGYLLPNPKLPKKKKKDDTFLPNTPEQQLD